MDETCKECQNKGDFIELTNEIIGGQVVVVVIQIEYKMCGC